LHALFWKNPHRSYRRAFDVLIEQLPDKQACKIAVELLALAHDRGCERELAEELARTLDAGELPDLAALRALFGPDWLSCRCATRIAQWL
jgi:hypothetical protein